MSMNLNKNSSIVIRGLFFTLALFGSSALMAQTTVTNEAFITPPTTVIDPILDNNQDPETNPVIPFAPALSTTKILSNNADEDGSGNVTLGDTLSYTLTVTNTGNVTLTGVTLTDSLIATLDCTPLQPAELDPTEQLVCTGEHVVQPGDVTDGQVVNTATGDSDQTPPDLDQVITPVVSPEVSVSKASDPISGSSVTAGQSIAYTVTATISNAPLTSPLSLSDTLDADLTFGSVTSAGGFSANTVANPLQFTLPAGTAPGTYSVSYTATVNMDATDTVGNSVVVTNPGGDPSPQCPDCTTTHPITDPQVVVNKDSDPVTGSQVSAGQLITYTLTATISDAALTSNLDLSDTLDANLNFGSVTNAGSFASNTAGNPIVFNLPSGTLPGTYSVSYTATVASDAVGSVGNSVVITGPGGDPDPECPSCTTSHPVVDPQVQVNKDSNPASGSIVAAGENITYTLTAVITDAPLTAALELSDTLGPDLTFGSVTSAGAYSANTAGNPLLFTLPSGTEPGSYSVSYTATVNNNATGTVVNSVVISGPGGDPDPECPSCTTSHPVFNMQFEKLVTGLTSTGPNRWLVTYDLIIESIGDGDGQYTLIDTLNFTSDGIVLGDTANAATTQGSMNPGLISGNFTPQNGVGLQVSAANTSISAGAQHRYTINVPFAVVQDQLSNGQCTDTPGNGLYNLASLTGSTIQIEDDACASIDEGSDVAIHLLKTVELGIDSNGNNLGDVGDVLFYAFEITNIGNDPLTDIQLIDLLVDDLVCAPQTTDGEQIQVLPWDGISIRSFERGGLGSLNAGEALVCTASHTLTADDVARRRVENTATVIGTGPLGEVVTSVSTAIYTSFQ